MQEPVNLDKFLKKILYNEDKILFTEALNASSGGALRAAYIMIWLSCAESLKRRFREVKKSDNEAGKIVGIIQKYENEKKSVDKILLQRAAEYGFLSTTSHHLLEQIYEKRCIYGHPYEEAPSSEQLLDAADVVVNHLLSKPVKFNQGYAMKVLELLLNDPNYLDDYEPAVRNFADTILPKFNESIYDWFLHRYWKELHQNCDPKTMPRLFNRGVWFTQQVLRIIDANIFSKEKWHELVSEYPTILMAVCAKAEIFESIGEQAQDYLVSSILQKSITQPSTLIALEKLLSDKCLTTQQEKRFRAAISEMGINSIRSSQLSTKNCYENIVDSMKSYDWYKQNPAIDLILSNGPEQVAELDNNQQITLGRNILQCAQGSANSATNFLNRLYTSINDWPYNIIYGIVIECFVNEKNTFRLKINQLSFVLRSLEKFDEEQRKKLVKSISNQVKESDIKHYFQYEEEEKNVFTLLGKYPWIYPLKIEIETQLNKGKTSEFDEN